MSGGGGQLPHWVPSNDPPQQQQQQQQQMGAYPGVMYGPPLMAYAPPVQWSSYNPYLPYQPMPQQMMHPQMAMGPPMLHAAPVPINVPQQPPQQQQPAPHAQPQYQQSNPPAKNNNQRGQGQSSKAPRVFVPQSQQQQQQQQQQSQQSNPQNPQPAAPKPQPAAQKNQHQQSQQQQNPAQSTGQPIRLARHNPNRQQHASAQPAAASVAASPAVPVIDLTVPDVPAAAYSGSKPISVAPAAISPQTAPSATSNATAGAAGPTEVKSSAQLAAEQREAKEAQRRAAQKERRAAQKTAKIEKKKAERAAEKEARKKQKESQKQAVAATGAASGAATKVETKSEPSKIAPIASGPTQAELEAAAAEKERIRLQKEKEREEQERKKKEEEEAEAKRRAEEEAKRKEEEKKATIAGYEEAKKNWEELAALRQRNLAAQPANALLAANSRGSSERDLERERDAADRQLDSSMKRITAFIRKLKEISTQSLDGLKTEMKALNLRRYVTEVVDSLSEAKLTKPSDVAKSVQISSIMHQRYPDFSPALIPRLLAVVQEGLPSAAPPATRKVTAVGGTSVTVVNNSGSGLGVPAGTTAVPVGGAADGKDAEKDAAEQAKNLAARKRSTLRFLTELLLAGVFTDVASVLHVIRDTIVADKGDDPEFSNLAVVVSFLRYAAEDLFGIVSRKQKVALEAAGLSPLNKKLGVLTDPQLEQCKKLFNDYFNTVSSRYVAACVALRRRENKNRRLQLMHGELNKELLERTQSMREAYEKLERLIGPLCDLLDKDLPELPPEEEESEEMKIFFEDGTDAAAQGDGTFSFFDDEPTRSFYQDLKNLQLIVPPVLLKGEGFEKEKAKERRLAEEKETGGDSATTVSDTAAAGADDASTEQPKEDSATVEAEYNMDMKLEDFIGIEEGADVPTEDSAPALAADADGDGTEKEKKIHPLELMLQTLPTTAFSRDAVDSIAEKFCYYNNKNNRKRLLAALFAAPKNQVELLPYYSRLAATLTRCLEDIGPELVDMLMKDFYRLLRRKDQSLLDWKLRDVRFLGELLKFGVCPPQNIFRVWHACMLDFKAHSIHMINSLLECCGRFLFRNPVTQVRCGVFLERMMQLKKTKFLDKHLENLIENAYFYCKPPVASAITPLKKRPPMQQYIRKLIFVDLSPTSVDQIVTKLRKLPWNDQSIHDYVIACLADVSQVKYNLIRRLASLVSGIAGYHTDVSDLVIDSVLEEIRFGLEQNNFTQYQRRLTYVKYLGELYVYRLFYSPVIFETLYLLITFGAGQIDPPNDFFRIRLVCVLLKTVGFYFDQGMLAKRLDRFLLFFQQYIMQKDPLPVDIEFLVNETILSLRPTAPKFKSLEEVQAKIAENDKEFRAADREVMPIAEFKKKLVEASGLNTISEDAKDGDDNAQEDGGESEDDAEDEHDGEEEEDEETRKAERTHVIREDEEDENKSKSQPNAAPAAPAPTEEAAATEGDQEEEPEETFHRPEHRSKEDDEFMREFEKLVSDSVDSRKYEAPKSNLPPAYLLSGRGVGGLSGKSSGIEVQKDKDGEEHVVFKLVTRAVTQNKSANTERTLLIPMESEIASNTLEAERALKEEQEKVKKRVLKGLEREEKELDAQLRLEMSVWGKNIRHTDADAVDFSHRGTLREDRPHHGRVKGQGWETHDIQQLESQVMGKNTDAPPSRTVREFPNLPLRAAPPPAAPQPAAPSAKPIVGPAGPAVKPAGKQPPPSAQGGAKRKGAV